MSRAGEAGQVSEEVSAVGDRWIITVACPKCGFIDNDVYFAPTCDFVDWKCPTCGHIVDLVEQTGVTYEDASNADVIAQMCDILLPKGEI